MELRRVVCGVRNCMGCVWNAPRLDAMTVASLSHVIRVNPSTRSFVVAVPSLRLLAVAGCGCYSEPDDQDG
jgi:hypothetical protein